ncbi:MAG: CRISPR-associated endonuclease Cas2 [Candidatus Micrarchaeaceae archaeon]
MAYRFGVIVSYDCTSDNTRQKIIDTCLNFDLARIQYSVFTGSLTAPALKDLKTALKQIAKNGGPISVLVQKIAIGEINDFELIEKMSEKLHRFHKYSRGKLV